MLSNPARMITRATRGAVLLLPALACQPAEPPAHGGAASATRTHVALAAEDEAAVRREMHDLLAALGASMEATVRGDTAALIAALAPAGSAAAADPALEEQLPPAWKELAEAMHAGFDTLALVARHAPDRAALADTVLTRLARITTQCSACHAQFRLIAP